MSTIKPGKVLYSKHTHYEKKETSHSIQKCQNCTKMKFCLEKCLHALQLLSWKVRLLAKSFLLFFCGCTKIIKHGGHNLLHYFGQGSDGQWIQQLLLLLYVAHPLFKLVTSDLCSSENIWSCVRIRQVNRSILLCKKDFCLHYFLASKTTTAKKSFYSSSCSRWRKLNQHISAKSVFFFLFFFLFPVRSVFYNGFFNWTRMANKQKLDVSNLAGILINFLLISKVTGIINGLFFPLWYSNIIKLALHGEAQAALRIPSSPPCWSVKIFQWAVWLYQG